MINPIHMIKKVGEVELRSMLNSISIEMMHKMVSKYTPDRTNTVHKWTKRKRIEDYIVARSVILASK